MSSDWRYFDWHKCPMCGKTWQGNYDARGVDPFQQTATYIETMCDDCGYGERETEREESTK